MSLLALVQERRVQLGWMLAGLWCVESFAARVVGLGIGAGCADLQDFLVEAAGLNIGLLFSGVQK